MMKPQGKSMKAEKQFPNAQISRKGDKGRFYALAPILFLSTLFTGCNFAPEYARPEVQTPGAFKELNEITSKETDGWKTAEPKDDAIRGNWWEIFNDPQLNALEEEVNASNQSVALALANFLAARSVVKQARSQFFPVVTTAPSVTRGKAALQNQAGSSSLRATFTEYSLPVDASWEMDLWGRVRNSVKASSMEAEAAFADLENVRLTVKAELAADYFQIRALDALKQLLEAAVLAYQESFNLTQIRLDTGIASEQDVAQAETQLKTTAAQATDIGIQRSQLEHAIALLMGKPASSFSLAVEPLSAKPQAIPFDVPSHLLERRPDIAAAERRVAELNAQIGVARAAYFPTLTLSGSVGYQSTSLADLVNWPSFAWSVGASLAETLFDAGKRKAVTEQSWANYQGTVASYRQTVLTAFQEVEDNLSTLRILSQELQQQEAAVKSSQRYLTLANERYTLGIDSYLNVITAQALLLNNQRNAVSVRAQQMTSSVQLIKALGGGWDAAQIASGPRNSSDASRHSAAR